RIGRKLVTTPPFKLVDGFHQTDVAFLNQIQKLQTTVGVLLRNRNHEAQICLDQLALGLAGLLFTGDDRLQSSLDLDWSYEVVDFNFQQTFSGREYSSFEVALFFRLDPLTRQLFVATINLTLGFAHRLLHRAYRVDEPL